MLNGIGIYSKSVSYIDIFGTSIQCIFGVMKPTVTLYSLDNAEFASLTNIKNEFERRGYTVLRSGNLHQKSEIGIYAIHANHFYNFDLGILNRPNSLFSVSMLHDFGQDNGDQDRYFRNDTWEVFDFGLVINETWGQFLKSAVSNGVKGPIHGFTIGGYPKSDDLFMKIDSVDLASRMGLGSTEKVRVLLACSWQNREHLTMAINSIDQSRYQIVSKAFDYETNFTAMIDSPWEDVFLAQREEGRLLNSFYGFHPEIVALPPETNIFDAIEFCDVVVSNGSNVMYEGILSLKPAICVTDWSQPAGLHGEEISYSKINSPGIINAASKDLNEAIELSLTPQSRMLISRTSESLLEPKYRGRSAEISVSEILSAFDKVVGSKDRNWLHPYAREPREIPYFTEIHKHQQNFKSSIIQHDSSQSLEPTTEDFSRVSMIDKTHQSQRDSAVAERDSAVAERDSAVAERDSAVAERDSAVAERDSIKTSRIWRMTRFYRLVRKPWFLS